MLVLTCSPCYLRDCRGRGCPKLQSITLNRLRKYQARGLFTAVGANAADFIAGLPKRLGTSRGVVPLGVCTGKEVREAIETKHGTSRTQQ